MSELRRTVLHELHRAHGARFGPFAGWEMPLRYGPGPMAEHLQCRHDAALFDVSHMTVLDLAGDGLLEAMERLVPADLAALGVGRLKYTFFTNELGGIRDDVMITRRGPAELRIVLNADGTEEDIAYLRAELPARCAVQPRRDLALVALQGPESERVLARHAPAVSELTFLQEAAVSLFGRRVELSRSGYTGGEGFELALPADHAQAMVEALLAEPEVEPAGLAARDSLRLEAGLCLYGHDLDTSTSPVEAGLLWAIPAARRHAEAGYKGAAVVAAQVADGPSRRRVGLRPIGRRPVREGAELRCEQAVVGRLTSGGYSPVLGSPIAMGYVETAALEALGAGTAELTANVGDRSEPVQVTPLPFVAKTYRRPSAHDQRSRP